MKPQKPRVFIVSDSTFVTIRWNAVPGASYYTVKYSLLTDSTTFINTLNVTSCSVILTSLYPDTEYVVYVSTTIITQSSQFTTLNFRTLASNVMENKGSGNDVYPAEFSHTYDLEKTSLGYSFQADNESLYVDGKFFQFCTFDLGVVKDKSYLKLQLQGASGNWKTSSEKRRHFDHTILQVKIQGHTGWMDANALRVPGISDKEDGARVFDGTVDEQWNTVRITLSNLSSGQYEGNLYVRIGLTGEEQQSICGVKIFS